MSGVAEAYDRHVGHSGACFRRVADACATVCTIDSAAQTAPSHLTARAWWVRGEVRGGQVD